MVTSPLDYVESKKADLAGPGIGNYTDVEKILPRDYHPLLNPKETQQAIFQVKRFIVDNLCKELNLMMVEVRSSAVRRRRKRRQRHARSDGSRIPIQFHISNRSR